MFRAHILKAADARRCASGVFTLPTSVRGRQRFTLFDPLNRDLRHGRDMEIGFLRDVFDGSSPPGTLFSGFNFRLC